MNTVKVTAKWEYLSVDGNVFYKKMTGFVNIERVDMHKMLLDVITTGDFKDLPIPGINKVNNNGWRYYNYHDFMKNTFNVNNTLADRAVEVISGPCFNGMLRFVYKRSNCNVDRQVNAICGKWEMI